MKKLILFILIATISLPLMSFGQDSHSGLKGGLNLSSLSTDGNNDQNLKVGFHVGVFNKIALSESFAIQPELLYSVKGMRLNYDDNAGAEGESKFNLNYIDLPVKLVFNLSEDFDFHFGPYISYLVYSNVETDARFFDVFDVDSDHEIDRDNFHALDYGITAGLGFDLDPIMVGFDYGMGFNSVAKDDEPSHDVLGDAKNTVIQIYVGLKF